MGCSGKESLIKVAAVQWEPQICQRAHNLERSVSLIHDAAKRGANLIVLPEMCNSGYAFESREEAFEQGESVPDGPTIKTWTEATRVDGIYLVAGMIEKEGDCLYNTAVLLGPDGYVEVIGQHHRNRARAAGDVRTVEPGELECATEPAQYRDPFSPLPPEPG